jgi:hypothetical protein
MQAFRGKTVASRQVGNVTVIVHSAAPPADDEWNELMSESSTVYGPLRGLVYTAGGAPNAAQRAKLTSLYGNRQILIAVLTESAFARAAGTALRWFRPEVRMFSPRDVNAALDYLQVEASARAEVVRVLDDLKAELNLDRRSA